MLTKKLSPFVIFIIVDTLLALVIVGIVLFYRMPKNAPNSGSSQNFNSKTVATTDWPVYSIKGLDFNHPANYAVATKVVNPEQSVITVTATGQDRRMAIFKKTDFNNGGPTWIFPEMNDRAGEYLPSEAREELTAGEFGVWLFYEAGDEAAKAELHTIVDSIKTN